MYVVLRTLCVRSGSSSCYYCGHIATPSIHHHRNTNHVVVIEGRVGIRWTDGRTNGRAQARLCDVYQGVNISSGWRKEGRKEHEIWKNKNQLPARAKITKV